MNEQEAEQALAIVREVIQNTREDIVDQNWGRIWMLHAFTNLAAFLYIGHGVEAQGRAIFHYLVPLAAVGVVNIIIVLLLLERDRGVRSVVEWQVHGIWCAYVVSSLVGAGVLHMSGAPPTLFCPVLAITSGISFAMMGIVFNLRFIWIAVAFFCTAIVAPVLPTLQWDVFAATWCGALFATGYFMNRTHQQRKADAGRTAIL